MRVKLEKSELVQEKSIKPIKVEIVIEDEKVRNWLQKNTSKIQTLINKLIVDLYYTDQILHSD